MGSIPAERAKLDNGLSAILQRFIRDELPPTRGWSLIEWCITHGGEEFSFQLMTLGDSPPAHESLTNALAPFHRGTLNRENMTTLAGEARRRPTETWRLTAESAGVLRQHVAEGLFASPSYSPAGWLENFTIYRRGEIMLGTVSHEGLVVIFITEQEQRELSRLRIESQ